MRRDGRFTGRLLRVRESFEEQKDRFTFEFGAGGGSLPCHLRLPSALVSAT
jgi:hypothetical protein